MDWPGGLITFNHTPLLTGQDLQFEIIQVFFTKRLKSWNYDHHGDAMAFYLQRNCELMQFIYYDGIEVNATDILFLSYIFRLVHLSVDRRRWSTCSGGWNWVKLDDNLAYSSLEYNSSPNEIFLYENIFSSHNMIATCASILNSLLLIKSLLNYCGQFNNLKPVAKTHRWKIKHRESTRSEWS